VLWAWNYQDFLHLGSAVALNGRYLFPVMPPLLLVIGLAYRELSGRHQARKALLFAAVVVLFLQGGGVLTFIDASNNNRYWANGAGAQTPLIMRHKA
jgi:hypothetical protein